MSASEKGHLKCIWCNKPRSRNDLCNRCRQKVESRARRLNEQRMSKASNIFEQVVSFINNSISNEQYNNMSRDEYNQLLIDIFPFLFLRFQADATFRGNRNHANWNLAESSMRIVMKDMYKNHNKESENRSIKIKLDMPFINGKNIDNLKRQELCSALENTVLNIINTHKHSIPSQNIPNNQNNQNNEEIIAPSNTTNNTHVQTIANGNTGVSFINTFDGCSNVDNVHFGMNSNSGRGEIIEPGPIAATNEESVFTDSNAGYQSNSSNGFCEGFIQFRGNSNNEHIQSCTSNQKQNIGMFESIEMSGINNRFKRV